MNNQTTTNTGRGSKNKFTAAQEMVEDARETVMDSANSIVGDVRERAGTYFNEFNTHPVSFIRNNPLTAAIGGVFVGLILGAAVGRRSIR